MCCYVALLLPSAVMDLAHYRLSIVLHLTCVLYALKDGFHAPRALSRTVSSPRRDVRAARHISRAAFITSHDASLSAAFVH